MSDKIVEVRVRSDNNVVAVVETIQKWRGLLNIPATAKVYSYPFSEEYVTLAFRWEFNQHYKPTKEFEDGRRIKYKYENYYSDRENNHKKPL